jgi:glycosyltransferase involved in cell wall biosynthesis
VIFVTFSTRNTSNRAVEKEKIRILRIINRFNIGGPTYNATFLTRFMGEQYETMLIGGLPEEGESDSLYILNKYGVEPVLIDELVRNPDLSSDRKAYKRIKEIISEFNPHIVHTHASKAGALGRRAAISCKVPVVVHTFHGHVFHSYFGAAKTLLFKGIERRLAKKSNAIIAISDKQREELVHEHKISKPEKTKVVNLGFDLDPFNEKRQRLRETKRRELGLSDEVAIALIGRFVPIKNHEMFFDVVEEILAKTNKKVKFFVVGDGTEREYIEERAEKINRTNAETVVLTSWIKDIGSFNAAMDIVCMTSLNEGTPVSLIEAQAANIPVISTDVGGVRDVVIDGETGFIVPSKDVSAFSEKLLKLIEDEKKRLELSQNGWTFVKDKFHYKTLVKNMEQIYAELLKNKEIEVS